jgi:plasmid stabilization system protein ParE
MRRLRVEFRPSANVDIATIFEYIFEASRSSAVGRRFIRCIRDRCERIGDVPLITVTVLDCTVIAVIAPEPTTIDGSLDLDKQS